jgi:thioredoxin reductase (NADPH)
MLDRAKADPKIRWQLNSQLTGISGDGKVSGARLRDTVTGAESELPVTGVFIAVGHDPRSDLVRGQVELDPDGYVLTEGRGSYTDVDGVFACGDLVDHTYRQAITAAGSGCAAAIDAERWLAEHGQADAETVAELVGGGYAPVN